MGGERCNQKASTFQKVETVRDWGAQRQEGEKLVHTHTFVRTTTAFCVWKSRNDTRPKLGTSARGTLTGFEPPSRENRRRTGGTWYMIRPILVQSIPPRFISARPDAARASGWSCRDGRRVGWPRVGTPSRWVAISTFPHGPRVSWYVTHPGQAQSIP